MALESVTHNWGDRKDMIQYWNAENFKTKSEKSKKKDKKKPVSYYDILVGPQKWMLLDAYQKFDLEKTRTCPCNVTYTINALIVLLL